MPLTSTLEKTPPPLPGKTVDNTLPTVGGNLAVVPDSETSSGFTLSWTKGSDPETADANMKYLVYLSAQNNITGVTNAEANGTLLNPNEADQLDRNTYQVTGQSPVTQYWATVILKDQGGNKSAYGVVTATTIAATAEGQDSQAGDEAFLDALSASVTGLNTSWNTPISLDSGSAPTGVTTQLIGAEYRVTAIDLRPGITGMSALGGSLDIPEWKNIKECVLINTAHNSFDTQYPNDIHKIGSSLKYLYLNYSDHSLEASYITTYVQPHDYAENETPGHLDPGKDSGSGNSIFRGTINSDINNLTSLEGFMLSYTDDFGVSGRTPNTVNGIESIPSTFWDLIPTLKYIQFYDNWNVAGSGNTFSFPSSFGGVDRPLRQLFLGGGTGSTWDEDLQGFMVGSYPSDLNLLTNIKTFWTERNAQLNGFPDLENSTGLVSLVITFTDMTGSLPSWVTAGTHTLLDSFAIDFPTNAGMTGNFDISTAYTRIDNISVADHAFSGAIPISVWQLDPNKCNFGQNLFTSLESTDLTGLTSMSTLRFYRNDIEGQEWPKLDWSKSITQLRAQWNRIRFEENRYVFADMLYVPDNAPSGETTFELYCRFANGITLFKYDNQKAAGSPNTYNIGTGGSLTVTDFNTVYTHADNSYQWYKDGSPVSGQTSRELSITDASASDAGIYTLQVTNSTFANIASNYGFSNLTLTSAEIEIMVS